MAPRQRGAPFATFTTTAADVVTLPAASRATAVKVCVPSAASLESHDASNGAAESSAPTCVGPSKNLTPATPTLSAAAAVIVTIPETVSLAGAVMLTAGAATSGFTTTVTTPVVVSPASSRIS